MRTSAGVPGRRRSWFVTVLVGAAPWSWFLVRDRAAALDVVATGLPVVVACLVTPALAFAVFVRRAAPAVFALSTLVMGTVAVVGPWLPLPGPTPVNPLRLVSVNVRDGNRTPGGAVTDIWAQRGDVVAVVEGAALVEAGLRRRYAFASRDETSEHLVVSRFPVQRLSMPAQPGSGLELARWELRPPSGPIILYTVHLDHPALRQVRGIRPELRHQHEQVGAILRAVADEQLPTMVVGDLNMSDRSWGYRRLAARLSDAMRAERSGPTYVRIRYRPFLLRIDHLFVPRSWCSDTTDRFRIAGSDHQGVAANVGPCP